MKHNEFKIGLDFSTENKRWRVTDIGTRVIVAIRIDEIQIHVQTPRTSYNKTIGYEEADTNDWFNGPPYAVEEIIFDEYDQESCELI